MIIGIDPGYSGGVAFYCEKEKRLIAVLPMPTKTVNGGLFGEGKPRREVDGEALAEALIPYVADSAFVSLEQVTSSPQMGVTSAFRFGEGYGVILGVIAALGLRVKYCTPSVWKVGMGLGSDKGKSISLAMKLFPEWAETFSLRDNKSADLSEAALLAYYGLRFLPKSPDS